MNNRSRVQWGIFLRLIPKSHASTKPQRCSKLASGHLEDIASSGFFDRSFGESAVYKRSDYSFPYAEKEIFSYDIDFEAYKASSVRLKNPAHILERSNIWNRYLQSFRI